jgi:hypothetical protein
LSGARHWLLLSFFERRPADNDSGSISSCLFFAPSKRGSSRLIIFGDTPDGTETVLYSFKGDGNVDGSMRAAHGGILKVWNLNILFFAKYLA